MPLISKIICYASAIIKHIYLPGGIVIEVSNRPTLLIIYPCNVARVINCAYCAPIFIGKSAIECALIFESAYVTCPGVGYIIQCSAGIIIEIIYCSLVCKGISYVALIIKSLYLCICNVSKFSYRSIVIYLCNVPTIIYLIYILVIRNRANLPATFISDTISNCAIIGKISDLPTLFIGNALIKCSLII